jgi:DNA polymerase III gamma/tau subunit
MATIGQDRDAESITDQLITLIRVGRVTSDDIRYMRSWVQRIGACDEVREALRLAGREWMCELVGQTGY